jgi:hypothetical protein
VYANFTIILCWEFPWLTKVHGHCSMCVFLRTRGGGAQTHTLCLFIPFTPFWPRNGRKLTVYSKSVLDVIWPFVRNRWPWLDKRPMSVRSTPRGGDSPARIHSDHQRPVVHSAENCMAACTLQSHTKHNIFIYDRLSGIKVKLWNLNYRLILGEFLRRHNMAIISSLIFLFSRTLTIVCLFISIKYHV